MTSSHERRTKLVCTIGPASVGLVRELVAAGMDVARINFSHGTPDEQKDAVHAVRAAAHSARRSVAVMVDLPGPKIRLGELAGGEIELTTGASFELRPAADEAAEPVAPAGESLPAEAAPAAPTQTGQVDGVSVNRPGLVRELEPGDRLLLADGAVELSVVELTDAAVRTEVVQGGVIRSRSGVNVPGERLTGDALTDADRQVVPRALELRADMIAQSFVRNADDVRALRALLPADGARLVAKIETRAAIDNFDAICEVADGVMIARGDLGVDLPYEQVPVIQKDLIGRATAAERFSIVATQMLESMINAPRPTRAEASDVANAVLDGADAVMLSAETAIGHFPVESVEAMRRICAAVEGRADYAGDGEDAAVEDASVAVILSAGVIARVSSAGAIWCFTRTGRTAELLSLTRPGVPIAAFTLSPVVARRLAVRRGVVPIVLAASGSGQLLDRMRAAWRNQQGQDAYDRVVLVTTSDQPSGINRLEIASIAG